MASGSAAQTPAGDAPSEIDVTFHLTPNGPEAATVGLLGGRLIKRPSNLPNATLTLYVNGVSPSINVQVVDAPVGGGGQSIADPNGSQSGLNGFGANNPWIVMGLQALAGLKITSVSGTGVTVDAWITFHSGQRASTTADSTAVSQGGKGTVAQGWYVVLTDLTNTVAIDNSRALAVSLNGQGAGTPGDTALRVATTRLPIAAQAITAGVPATLATPPAGKKWRVLGYSLSTLNGASLIFKSNTTEMFRTPALAAAGLLDSAGGGQTNGQLGNAANDPLKLDATVNTTVSGYVDVEYE